MDEEKEYQTVILAALLHDIGKLLQRGSFFGSLDIKGKHPQVSSDFISAYYGLFNKVVDAELLKTLVQHHHENPNFPQSLRVDGISDHKIRKLATLISMADNFSASERGERSEQWQDFKFTPLASVIQRVQIPLKSTAENTSKSPSLHFRARPLKDTQDEFFSTIFPESFNKYEEGELNQSLKEFGSDFASWTKKIDSINYDTLLYHLVHFLYKFAWCIPSNTQEDIPDVSLFDHLKTTAAIASCLYLYHKDNDSLTENAVKAFNKNRFCLVAGDISGIQNYIFGISNIGAGGVARKLRSRSLFIQLVTEACAMKILKDFNLPVTNVLMSAGGNFHLLVPNISSTKMILSNVNEEIDLWFLKNLNGEIALNLANTDFDGNEFKASLDKSEGFGGVLRRANDKLASFKQQRFSSVLKKASKWENHQFVIEVDFKGQEACQSCGKFPREDSSEELCIHCKLDRDTGKDLPGKSGIAFYASSNTGDISLPYGSASLIAGIPGKGDNPELVIKFNSNDLSDLSQFPVQSKFIATYIPEVEDEADKKRIHELGKAANMKGKDLPDVGQPVTFELLALQASGRPYLGFLKIDADNMGTAIVFGLKRESQEAGLDTISRLATVSRQIEWFFSGWVQHLISQSFKNCYIVFSGGDDLFLIGPWNEILELADKIRSDYARYTGNPELTLSAGMVISSSSYPVSEVAEAASDAMKKSKTDEKNRITLLGHTLSWGDWIRVREKWVELKEKVESEKISSAFLYSLLEYGQMWRHYKEDGLVSGLRFQPLLAYNISRNLNTRQCPTFCQWAQSIISLRLDEMQQKQVILDNLGLLAHLLILGKGGKQ